MLSIKACQLFTKFNKLTQSTNKENTMNRKDLLQRLANHFKAQSKRIAEMLQVINDMNKKIDENSNGGSSDGLGSASMSMKILELQFAAVVQYFQDIEDPDKEASEILNELVKIVDLLEAANVVDTLPLMRKSIDQAIEYKFKHTGEEFILDPKKMMTLIKEFVTDSNNSNKQKTLKEALAELEKTHSKKSTNLKL